MPNWRINLVFIFLTLFAITIILKLVDIQITNGGFYRAQALGQQKYLTQIEPTRGEFFFNKGDKELAVNKKIFSIYISPEEISQKEEVSQILSEIFGLEKELLLSKIQGNKAWELVKRRINKEELSKFEKIKLEGVYLKKESERYYPQENLASHIVGFLGGENMGQYGLEGYYDEILKGAEGIEQIEKGARGDLALFDSKIIKPLEFGTDLILTVDYNIQFMTESILKEALEINKAESGEIIVINPYDGEILAMAILPSFNPNKYFEENNLEIFQNSSIQKLFEPGSIFKPFTMAIALNEEKITPQTTFEDKGFVKIGPETIKNYNERVWGERTMTEVLERSINTGAVFVQSLLEHEIFWDYFEKFGFTQPTGIDLQGEIFSKNLNLKDGRDINYATASFGQGIEVTSIQLVRGFCAIANGGKLVTPHLVKEQKKGELITKITPEVSEDSIISLKTDNDLITMLVNVVEQGTGKAAKVPGYHIAGKTGTAQIPYTNLGIKEAGYSEKTIQSFIGFVPAFNPKFLIFVKLFNPQTKEAAISVAPVFQKLAKYIIDYYQIPPDYE